MKLLRVAAICVIAITAEAIPATPAVAGIYSDDLAKCLVSSTTPTDKNFLIKWMFATISLNPALSSVNTFSDAERDRINKKLAAMFERLLTRSCRSQAKKAIAYEGMSTLESSFGVLGRVAATRMFSNPAVKKGVQGFTNYLDGKKLQDALGVSDSPTP
jgi:hypothetical protein